MFYQEKNWPEKTAAIKKFEYLPLGNELKKVEYCCKKNNTKDYTRCMNLIKKGNAETINGDDKKNQHLKSIVNQI